MSDRLLDTISRTLASPIPRRSAVKLIAGGMEAAAAAFLSGREARAACKKNETACGQNCCPPGHECVTEGNNRKRCQPHKPSKSDR